MLEEGPAKLLLGWHRAGQVWLCVPLGSSGRCHCPFWGAEGAITAMAHAW